MFLLPSLLLGLVFAVLLGGRPSRLVDVSFRLAWTVPVALAIQIVIFSRLGDGLEPRTIEELHVASYVILLGFAAANLRVRVLVPVLLGLAANATAILANHGLMPVSPGAARTVGISPGVHDNVFVGHGRLGFLGDVFALPSEFPLANVFSVGDILIGIGMMLFVVLVSIQDGGEPAIEPSRLLEPLRTSSYRVLAAGKLVSHAGDWITLTALVGWVYDTTGSTGQASLLLLARLAPPVLGGGIAALVVDRLPKQRLLVWIELARGLAVAGALYGVVSGDRTIVFAALAASGGLAAISNACVPSLLPSLLPAEQLASANAGLGIAKDGAMAAGALGSALILSAIGVSAALIVDVGTFAVSLVLFGLIRAPLARGAERERREVSRGSALRYVVSRRWLLVLVFSFAAATLATGLTNATLPRLLEDKLGFGAGGYGFGIAALATGLALGQALVGFARVGETAGRWIGAGLLVMAGLFGVLGLIDHGPTALLVLGAIGFVDGTTDVMFETVVQREADPRRYGAVFGFSYAFITMTMMGAVALAPLVNGLVEPGVAILGAGAVLVVAGAIALLGMPRTAAAPRPGGVLRDGADLSLVACNGLGEAAEAAAKLLASEGVSVEVLELNGNPTWNEEAVLATVRKTSKVVLVHGEDSGAEAAELVAVIADRAFEDLDGPIRRIRADADLAAELRDLAGF
jgi:Family of unknown function (DUF5317)/Major Facilitator Superfamily/Transketolase, C-terminal domain